MGSGNKQACAINFAHTSILCVVYFCSTEVFAQQNFAFQKLEAQFASSFIEKLAQTCETMLLQFDAVLSLEDVEVGSKLDQILKSNY